MMATEILMPELEVLRLLGRNVPFETMVKCFVVSTRKGSSEMVIIDRFEGLRRTSPSLMTLQGLSEMQEFVREESRNGWPDLRLACGLKMKDLSPAELQAIIETWMEAKKRYERGLASDKHLDRNDLVKGHRHGSKAAICGRASEWIKILRVLRQGAFYKGPRSF